MRRTSQGPIGIGTTFSQQDRFLGRRLDLTLEVVGYEENHTIALEDRIAAPYVAKAAEIAQEALVQTSSRFAAIQALIDAIAQATDEKGILELAARIGAEEGMLQNEQTKLNVLGQAAQGGEWARRQRVRELAVADIGSLRNLPAMGL